jgi:hypothetical protein
MKLNRGSIWIKAVTISPPQSHLRQLMYIYPIALCYDSDSHEEGESMFAAELLNFWQGCDVTFYIGSEKTHCRVYLELFASLQDQPERHSTNHLMLAVVISRLDGVYSEICLLLHFLFLLVLHI